MEVEYDEDKRLEVLAERNLDFALSEQVFEGLHMTVEDRRVDYGETRYITVGMYDGELVGIAWTFRSPRRRIITMRQANVKEEERYVRRAQSQPRR